MSIVFASDRPDDPERLLVPASAAFRDQGGGRPSKTSPTSALSAREQVPGRRFRVINEPVDLPALLRGRVHGHLWSNVMETRRAALSE